MSIRDLTQLVPPPESLPDAHARPDSWQSAQTQLGGQLPADLIELIDTYGAGCFDEFLWLLRPADENPNLDTLTQRRVRLDALHELRQQGEVLPRGVELDELLPWAVSDNGDVCYVITSGRASGGIVLINEARGDRWEEFAGSSVDFLVAVFSGAWKGSVFPDDFPSDQPRFEPASA